ncbi:hypothetical protein M3Y96_00048500 [Aphelenchoides besseyi]|nr:hypothetical protein M3Y96_00048500 [Aphelenchoides besseyi]
MPLDCDLLCLLTDRRRYIEILWRHRLLVTADERKAKRRFMKLMRGFDTEDLDVLKKAVESRGLDIKMCAPGPPMDLVEESESDDELPPPASSARRQSVISTHRVRRYSTVRMDHVGGATITTVTPLNHVAYTHRRGSHVHRIPPTAVVATNHVPAATTVTRGSQRSPHRPETSSQTADESVESRRRPTEDPLATQRGLKLIGETGEFEERGLIPQIDRPMSMPYLCCKMWRWKELQVDAALHRLDPLPWCRFGRVTINNATVSCCNPYHYGLWIRPELSTITEEPKPTGTVANGGFRLGERTGDTGFNEEMSARAARSIGHVRSTFQKLETAEEPPGLPPPPPPILSPISSPGSPLNNAIDAPLLNHLTSIHAQALSWGRLARWERKERIGEMVALVGQFVAIGRLAGTVFDGQDVKSTWDIDNHTSFALIRQTEIESFQDVWLYNSGDRPLFLCVSQSLNNPRSQDSIRRLSPGYCLRVHRAPTGMPTDSSTLNQLDDPTAQTANNLLPNTVAFLTVATQGWGIDYGKMYLHDVPCRYEVIFS